jgi:hypothetical protein
MFTLIIRILYMGNDIGGDKVAPRDAEAGAVWASNVEGMVAFVSAVDAADGAVTDPMLTMSVRFAALGGVVCRGVGAATQVASDRIPFKLAGDVACSVPEAVAAGALAERGSGLETSWQGPGSKDANGGL